MSTRAFRRDSRTAQPCPEGRAGLALGAGIPALTGHVVEQVRRPLLSSSGATAPGIHTIAVAAVVASLRSTRVDLPPPLLPR
jgi:hypothetical protein